MPVLPLQDALNLAANSVQLNDEISEKINSSIVKAMMVGDRYVMIEDFDKYDNITQLAIKFNLRKLGYGADVLDTDLRITW